MGVMLAGIAGCSTVQTLSGTGIVKVLPHYLDAGGNSTDGPTLLHRDVYQSNLRGNPELVKGPWQKEVRDGMECGMAFDNYSDIQEGDMIECFEVKEIARTLD